jgi:hypothetical protein
MIGDQLCVASFFNGSADDLYLFTLVNDTWLGTLIDDGNGDDVGRSPTVKEWNGRLAMAYYDNSNLRPLFAYDNGTHNVVEIIDPTGTAGLDVDLEIVDGVPHVCYRTVFDLCHAKRLSNGTWNYGVIYSVGTTGVSCSIAEAEGTVGIAFHTESGQDLLFGYLLSNETWRFETVDSLQSVGEYTDTACINGKFTVSYHDASDSDILRATRHSFGNWTIDVASNFDTNQKTSLGIVGTAAAIAFFENTNGRGIYCSTQEGCVDPTILCNVSATTTTSTITSTSTSSSTSTTTIV